MAKLRWWILGIAASPLILFLLLTLLLYLPPVQRWAVGIATHYATEATGIDISIQDVRLRFPLDLQLGGVKAIQPNDSLPQKKDTLINAERIICEVQLLPLLDSNVQVDILEMKGVRLNTSNLISDCRVMGKVGRLFLNSHGIDLRRDTLLLNKASLADADLDICLSDTAKEDTTKTPNPDWIIRYQDVGIKNSRILVHMPGDTINIGADIASLTTRNGTINLQEQTYQIEAIDLNGSRVKYDNRFETKVKGLDFNHIDASEINLGIDSFYYRQPDIHLKVRACNAREKSGLAIATLSGDIHLDSARVIVRDIALQTASPDRKPCTTLKGNVNMELTTFSDTAPGVMKADVDGSIGKRDIMLIAGSSIPDDLVKRWPDLPASLRCSMEGNLRHCVIDELSFSVPSLATITANATLNDISNVSQMTAVAKFAIDAYGNNGKVRGNATFGMKRMEYAANLNVSNLNISHFMPGSGMGRFTGNITAKGNGTELFKPSTAINASASIGSFTFGKYNLAGSDVSMSLRNGIAHAKIKTVSDILKTDISLDGKVLRNSISANVNADIHNIDFYALRITKRPLSLSFNGNIDVQTDMRDSHSLSGRIGNICITDTARTFTPNDIVAEVFTRPDSTHATVACGDFMLNGNFDTGYKRLMSFANGIVSEVERQISERIIDETTLRRILPRGTITIRSGKENPIARMLASLGYPFANLDTDLSVSSERGINGYVTADTLVAKDVQLDNIDLQFAGDEEQLAYRLCVNNGPDNPNFAFNASVNGLLKENGTTLAVAIDDADGKRGIDMGISAMMEQDDIRISILDNPVIAYSPFRVNSDNYIVMSRDMRVSADVRLLGSNGTNLLIYTNDENEDVLQDITLSINNLDLGDVTSALPFMPRVTGKTNSDFHFILDTEKMSVSLDSDLRSLAVEGSNIGNISLQTVYMPQDDGSHYMDCALFKDGEEVATVRGKYYFEGADMIDGELTMTAMPMDIINGFVPDQIVGMKGIAKGKLSVKGYVSSLILNGTVNLSESSLISIPYGIELKMDKKDLTLVNSIVLFDDYNLTSSNNNPITVDGYFDFSSISNMVTNLHLKGNNVKIIDAKENRRSEAYGAAFVNFNAQLNGELSSLNVKANLDVLPSTNLYYILRDSPITTDNRLNELVTFTDFNSNQTPVVTKPVVKGMSMDLNINVRNDSHIVCWLNGNHTNYLDIYGNGELRMRYSYGELKMTGRYTFSQGEMKYSLPIIPLKTFKISQDSYIEFTGDVMDPKLSITATEETRANANVDGNEQTVPFICGVVISKTLNDMGLEFIISSPENSRIEEHINSLSKEERGKLAVAMLTTGMYLDSNSSSKLSMNSALNSFLQSGISNIAGSALKTLDLAIGLENNTTPEGTMSMDYTFKFAKHFWNNRLSVAIGGKISTGTQSAGKTPSVFDNVEVQYRLSDNSNQYLQAFYKHDVFDYLEGYLDHFGAGYIWKRKLQNFSDIFGRKKQPVPQPDADAEKADTEQADTVTISQ